MLKQIKSYFLFKALKEAIGNAGLLGLRVLICTILAQGNKLTERHQEKLSELWLSRVLLLVTGINDVKLMLNVIGDDRRLYRRLCCAYGTRSSSSLADIIALLNCLWARYNTRNSFYHQAKLAEDVLIEHAKQLIGKCQYGLGHIECLAASINDQLNNGIGSRASEDLVNALAIAKIQNNFFLARRFARHFKLKRSQYRFYEAFIASHKPIGYSVVHFLTKEISAPEDGGRELARKVLEAVDFSYVMLDAENRQHLEVLAGKKTSPPTQPDILPSLFKDFVQAVAAAGILSEQEILQILREMKAEIINGVVAAEGLLFAKGARPVKPFGRCMVHKCFVCDLLEDCNRSEAGFARQIKERELAEVMRK